MSDAKPPYDNHVTLLTPQQAAEMLMLDRETVDDWVDRELIPFVRFPDGEVQIPLGALLLQAAIVEFGLVDLDWPPA